MFHFYGYVPDAETGRPIPGVTVKFYGSKGEQSVFADKAGTPLGNAVSDALGTVECWIPDGTYRIEYTHKGRVIRVLQDQQFVSPGGVNETISAETAAVRSASLMPCVASIVNSNPNHIRLVPQLTGDGFAQGRLLTFPAPSTNTAPVIMETVGPGGTGSDIRQLRAEDGLSQMPPRALVEDQQIIITMNPEGHFVLVTPNVLPPVSDPLSFQHIYLRRLMVASARAARRA